MPEFISPFARFASVPGQSEAPAVPQSPVAKVLTRADACSGTTPTHSRLRTSGAKSRGADLRDALNRGHPIQPDSLAGSLPTSGLALHQQSTIQKLGASLAQMPATFSSECDKTFFALQHAKRAASQKHERENLGGLSEITDFLHPVIFAKSYRAHSNTAKYLRFHKKQEKVSFEKAGNRGNSAQAGYKRAEDAVHQLASGSVKLDSDQGQQLYKALRSGLVSLTMHPEPAYAAHRDRADRILDHSTNPQEVLIQVILLLQDIAQVSQQGLNWPMPVSRDADKAPKPAAGQGLPDGDSPDGAGPAHRGNGEATPQAIYNYFDFSIKDSFNTNNSNNSSTTTGSHNQGQPPVGSPDGSAPPASPKKPAPPAPPARRWPLVKPGTSTFDGKPAAQFVITQKELDQAIKGLRPTGMVLDSHGTFVPNGPRSPGGTTNSAFLSELHEALRRRGLAERDTENGRIVATDAYPSDFPENPSLPEVERLGAMRRAAVAQGHNLSGMSWEDAKWMTVQPLAIASGLDPDTLHSGQVDYLLNKLADLTESESRESQDILSYIQNRKPENKSAQIVNYLSELKDGLPQNDDGGFDDEDNGTGLTAGAADFTEVKEIEPIYANVNNAAEPIYVNVNNAAEPIYANVNNAAEPIYANVNNAAEPIHPNVNNPGPDHTIDGVASPFSSILSGNVHRVVDLFDAGKLFQSGSISSDSPRLFGGSRNGIGHQSSETPAVPLGSRRAEANPQPEPASVKGRTKVNAFGQGQDSEQPVTKSGPFAYPFDRPIAVPAGNSQWLKDELVWRKEIRAKKFADLNRKK